MNIDSISSGAGPANEDVVAVHERGDVTELVIIDGGSSVADRHYIDQERGDVVWFAQEFAAALADTFSDDRTQHVCVQLAASSLHKEFVRRSAGAEVPAYAWPIAAITWARIVNRGAGHLLQLYSLGDCKTLLCSSSGAVLDLDPFVNPQEAVLQAEIAQLLDRGIVDAAHRREQLLPMLRARREAQNAALSPSILCLKAAGAFDARFIELELAPGSALLLATDGFYRLVDPYGLYSPDALAQRCLRLGVRTVLDELRAHEAACLGTARQSVKRADDASAIVWRPD